MGALHWCQFRRPVSSAGDILYVQELLELGEQEVHEGGVAVVTDKARERFRAGYAPKESSPYL